jgi:hypothetical protein
LEVKTFESIIVFSLITSTTYASTQENITDVKSVSQNNISVTAKYQIMSTAQLQEEVEKRSINGNLSFEMGMELIKRWTKR